MQKIFIALILLVGLSTATTAQAANSKKPAKTANYSKVQVRVTYWTHSESGYKWGTRIASDPKKRATEGTTVAVDRSKIPFGTKLYIPKLSGKIGTGLFIAEDSGSDVIRMRAIPKAKRGEIKYVIDIYVSSNEKMHRMAKTNPHYMEVYIFNETKPVQLAKN